MTKVAGKKVIQHDTIRAIIRPKSVKFKFIVQGKLL